MEIYFFFTVALLVGFSGEEPIIGLSFQYMLPSTVQLDRQSCDIMFLVSLIFNSEQKYFKMKHPK